MTRLEAIRHIRSGKLLEKSFPKEEGFDLTLEIWIQYQSICDFSRRKRLQHESIGPLHLRFWAVSMPHWIHITPKQLLGFIKRNYVRK